MNNWNIEGSAPDTRYSALFEICWMLFFGTVNILQSQSLSVYNYLSYIYSVIEWCWALFTLLLYANNYSEKSHRETVKILKIQTPEEFAVNTLKFEQNGFTVE